MAAPTFETVDRLATCKRCGDGLVAWKESKGGKLMMLTAHVSNARTFRIKAGAPYEFHVCIPNATPAQIDSALAELWASKDEAAVLWLMADAALKAIEDGTRRRYGNTVEHYTVQRADAANWISDLDRMIEPFEEEFVLRGKWLRYFLVKNAGGHVHRERNCSTCYPTTRYAWLVDLADCDESKMVDEYGTTACTVCFPDAPTMPGWARSEEAAKAAADEFCSAMHDYADVDGSTRLYRPWARCNACGASVSLTSTGKARKHKRAQVSA